MSITTMHGIMNEYEDFCLTDISISEPYAQLQ